MSRTFIASWRFSFSLLLSAILGYGVSAADPESSPRTGKIVEIEINGSINPSTVDYIKSGLSEAHARDATALLVFMDAPGGLLNSTKDTVFSKYLVKSRLEAGFMPSCQTILPIPAPLLPFVVTI
ncbi:MAG: hypothetical protein OXH71_00260 [Candidatus Dadabacteria bacterium]|nr:hypothetical protein [Candidatus Dadabacteria bacterium]MDE0519134.1 hypothetical protein [Candidatus Dadabacteria bacterium]MDE0663378.1 hypothetical protein [Candidatus Dadabacteria bacterium]